MRRKRITWRRALAFLLLAASIGGLWLVLPPQPRYVLRFDKNPSFRGFSPDGMAFVTVDELPNRDGVQWRGPIRLWDASTGRERATFCSGNDLFTSMRFCANGKLLVTKQDERETETLIDASTGKPCLDARGWFGCVSPDGRFVAFATQPQGAGNVKVWELATGADMGTFGGEWPVCFSPDGHYLLTRHFRTGRESTDTIRVWTVQTGLQTATIRTHPSVAGQEFSPDGKMLLLPGPDLPLRWSLVDVATGVQRADWPMDSEPRFAAVPGTLLYYDREPDQSLCIKSWDWETGKETIATKLEISGATCSPSNGRPSLCPSRWGNTAVVCVAYRAPSRLGRLAARWRWVSGWFPATRYREELKLLDTRTGDQIGTLPYGMYPRIFPDGRSFALQRPGNKIEVWDIPPRKSLGPFLLLSGTLVMLVLVVPQWRLYRLQRARRSPATEKLFRRPRPNLCAPSLRPVSITADP